MQIIGGKYRSYPLVSPSTRGTRPTLAQVRAAICHICSHDLPDAHFLDLFAGSGAVGLEVLSRGAQSVTFIEKDPHALRALYSNVAKLGVEDQISLLKGDVFRHVPRLQQKFTILFADPPYHKGYSQKILYMIDRSEVLCRGGSFFLEEAVGGLTMAEEELQTLTLKSQRRFGDTELHHFLRRS